MSRKEAKSRTHARSLRSTRTERRTHVDRIRESKAIADLIEKMPITRIVVSHRPALIRRAKRVFLVKDRQITEVPRRDTALVETLRSA